LSATPTEVDAFDADVLIYAAAPTNELGASVRELVGRAPTQDAIGSVLLIPELLLKPTRFQLADEQASLELLLAQLVLHPVSYGCTQLAVRLGARYGLKTVDSVHLATAVLAGADRFVTNNRRDFTKEITEVDVTYPDEIQ
jgi:predicted nucleic acid-binding protein